MRGSECQFKNSTYQGTCPLSSDILSEKIYFFQREGGRPEQQVFFYALPKPDKYFKCSPHSHSLKVIIFKCLKAIYLSIIYLTRTNHGFLCSYFWYMSSLTSSTSRSSSRSSINTDRQPGDPRQIYQSYYVLEFEVDTAKQWNMCFSSIRAKYKHKLENTFFLAFTSKSEILLLLVLAQKYISLYNVIP